MEPEPSDVAENRQRQLSRSPVSSSSGGSKSRIPVRVKPPNTGNSKPGINTIPRIVIDSSASQQDDNRVSNTDNFFHPVWIIAISIFLLSTFTSILYQYYSSYPHKLIAWWFYNEWFRLEKRHSTQKWHSIRKTYNSFVFSNFPTIIKCNILIYKNLRHPRLCMYVCVSDT